MQALLLCACRGRLYSSASPTTSNKGS